MTARYGSPLLNDKSDPLDELVFIILSQMTTGPSYERVFDRLKNAMPTWQILTGTSVSALASLIADVGLSQQRSRRLKQIADRLAQDFGNVSLAQLVKCDDTSVQQYRTSLPGVGVKTANCVMMYSLGRQILPVDTRTARVATRLGLVAADSTVAMDRDLSVVVRPALRLDSRENAVAHGRAVCRAGVRRVCRVVALPDRTPIRPANLTATNMTALVRDTRLLTTKPLIDLHL